MINFLHFEIVSLTLLNSPFLLLSVSLIELKVQIDYSIIFITLVWLLSLQQQVHSVKWRLLIRSMPSPLTCNFSSPSHTLSEQKSVQGKNKHMLAYKNIWENWRGPCVGSERPPVVLCSAVQQLYCVVMRGNWAVAYLRLDSDLSRIPAVSRSTGCPMVPLLYPGVQKCGEKNTTLKKSC